MWHISLQETFYHDVERESSLSYELHLLLVFIFIQQYTVLVLGSLFVNKLGRHFYILDGFSISVSLKDLSNILLIS